MSYASPPGVNKRSPQLKAPSLIAHLAGTARTPMIEMAAHLQDRIAGGASKLDQILMRMIRFSSRPPATATAGRRGSAGSRPLGIPGNRRHRQPNPNPSARLASPAAVALSAIGLRERPSSGLKSAPLLRAQASVWWGCRLTVPRRLNTIGRRSPKGMSNYLLMAFA